MRDLSLLESALARPWATFGGHDLFSKAAARMDALIHNHRRNGDRLTATNEELEGFARRVAESRPGIAEIADCLRTHTVPED